jgi:hypothetical protein
MSHESHAVRQQAAYTAIARNLREFGYPDVTAEMVREVYRAMVRGEDIPHGVVGMFAQGQLEDAGFGATT